MQQHKRYQELDALRGLAALMVAIFHLSNAKPEAGYCFKWGITGVDLFFMISGFVIFMSITKVKTGLEFAINRACRLYPAYWACVTCTFIVIRIAGLSPVPTFAQYFINLTMFQSFIFVHHLDSVYWTLTVEMLFYISILLLFLFKKLTYISFAAVLTCVASLIIGAYFDQSIKIRTIMNYLPLLQFAPLFFAGILFYKIYSEKTKLIERYAMIALCFTCQVCMYSYAGKSRILVSHSEYAVMLLIYFSLFILFVNHKLSAIVSKFTLFLGKISYPLYLLHYMIFAEICMPILTDKWHINYLVAAFAICLPLAIALAAFVTYMIEAPLNKFMKRKLKRIVATGQ